MGGTGYSTNLFDTVTSQTRYDSNGDALQISREQDVVDLDGTVDTVWRIAS